MSISAISLTGLLKIELPGETIRIYDGGFITFEGETYLSADPLFGNVASVEGISEGVGDEVPALEIVLQPPEETAVADLSQPGYQQSRARFWICEYDYATGQVIGEGQLIFDGQIDQTTLSVGKDERTLAMTIVSTAERLFERNLGNFLSPGFHKSVWPGELGHDNATGLKVPIAWGAASQGSGTSFVSGGSGGASPPIRYNLQ